MMLNAGTAFTRRRTHFVGKMYDTMDQNELQYRLSEIHRTPWLTSYLIIQMSLALDVDLRSFC